MVGALQTIGLRDELHSPVNIFIVDDEESSLSALGYRLMKENPFHSYKVHVFATGEECVKHMHLNPQIIIMDQYLACSGEGSLCGAGLIRKIRKIDEDVPVVIVSGKRKPEIAIEAEQDDSYYFMVRENSAYESLWKILGMVRDRSVVLSIA
jgi:two-component system, OmpR family, response regulator